MGRQPHEDNLQFAVQEAPMHGNRSLESRHATGGVVLLECDASVANPSFHAQRKLQQWALLPKQQEETTKRRDSLGCVMRVNIMGLSSSLFLMVPIVSYPRDRQKRVYAVGRGEGGVGFHLLGSLAVFCAAEPGDFPLAPLSAQFLSVFNSNGLRQPDSDIG